MNDRSNPAREIITAAFSDVAELHPFQTWGPTAVIGAALGDGRRLVLKASASQDVRIEAATSRRAAAAGVSTPAILAQGRDDRLPGAHWFVMDWLPGSRWCDVSRDDERDARILQALAELFSRLHRIPATGWGPRSLAGTGTHETWSGYLWASLQRPLNSLVSVGAMHDTVTRAAGNRISRLRTVLDQRPCTLLHADLGDGEVYVDERTADITGIVDWGSAINGDPLYEFARFVAGGPVDDPRPDRYTPILRQAYAAISTTTPASSHDTIEIERLYRLHNCLLNAEWSVHHAPDWTAGLCMLARELIG